MSKIPERMSKITARLLLLSQIENILSHKLLNFINVDLPDLKETRKRFDKASVVYDQAHEKLCSVRKNTKTDAEERDYKFQEHLTAKSSFEQARFNLVSAVSTVETNKRFGFVEALSKTMNSYLQYFEQGSELLHQMEPHFNQLLASAQQSRESTNSEQGALIKKMQENITRNNYHTSSTIPANSPAEVAGAASVKDSTVKGKVVL